MFKQSMINKYGKNKRYIKIPKILEDSHIKIGNNWEVITNPATGKFESLPPIAVAVYKYILLAEKLLTGGYSINRYAGYVKNRNKLLKDFDTARYWFNEEFPKEYITLLD